MTASSRRTLPERVRALPWLLDGAPRGLGVALGVVLVLAGLLLVARPFTALQVLGLYVGASAVVSGLADLVARPRAQDADDARPTGSPVPGWAWVALGLVVLVWLGRHAELFVPVVAAALVVSGVVTLVPAVRRRRREWWVAALTGTAEIVFGLLALLWPDATLVVLAVLFGGRTAVFGCLVLWRGLVGGGRERPRAVTPSAEARGRRTVLRGFAAVLVLALAVTTGLVSHTLRSGAPVVDAFYDTPDDVPPVPGHLVRWEEYHGEMPAGLDGFRLLYVTTDATDTPVLASAVLAVPAASPAPAPLVALGHGTVGVARGCAPSIGNHAIAEGAMPSIDALVRNGWAMVATDYPGTATEAAFPYLVGEGEGRAVLDAARAARRLPGVALSDQTVVWGHSQGGHAALWAGQLASRYAPELDVVGTAAISPAADPYALAASVLAHPDALGASLGVSFVLSSYTRYYDDLRLEDVTAPSARVLVREAASRCTSQGGTLVTVLAGLAVSRDQPIVREGSLDGPFGARLRENVPQGPWSMPLLLAHGEADTVIPFAITADYADTLCAAGTPVDFVAYPGETHMSLLETGSANNVRLEEWTRARLAGAPSSSFTCP